MRSRMETLSEGLSQDLNPAELEMGRLAINGLSLRMQRLVTSFGSWLTNWIRSLQSALSTNSRNGATGDLHLYVPTYEHPRGIEFVESNNDGRHSWLLQSGIGSGEPLIGMCHMIAQLPATPGNITKLGWSSGYSGPRPSANPSPQPARKLHSNFTDSGR